MLGVSVVFWHACMPMCLCTCVMMFHCDNVPVWQSTYQCDNAPVWRCTIVTMYQCDDVPLWQCDDVPVWRCTSVTMWKRTSVTMYWCDDLPVWQYSPVVAVLVLLSTPFAVKDRWMFAWFGGHSPLSGMWFLAHTLGSCGGLQMVPAPCRNKQPISYLMLEIISVWCVWITYLRGCAVLYCVVVSVPGCTDGWPLNAPTLYIALALPQPVVKQRNGT